jgi:hypothetical protein
MRPIKSAKLKQTRFPRVAIALRLAGFLLLLPGHLLSAQYAPIVSGAVGFFDSKNTGINFFQPAATNPGERAFQANCGRCHNPPEQLSPRITGTVLRHMRERALLSPQDERDILKYLAP